MKIAEIGIRPEGVYVFLFSYFISHICVRTIPTMEYVVKHAIVFKALLPSCLPDPMALFFQCKNLILKLTDFIVKPIITFIIIKYRNSKFKLRMSKIFK